jgi:hypothetical protein
MATSRVHRPGQFGKFLKGIVSTRVFNGSVASTAQDVVRAAILAAYAEAEEEAAAASR